MLGSLQFGFELLQLLRDQTISAQKGMKITNRCQLELVLLQRFVPGELRLEISDRLLHRHALRRRRARTRRRTRARGSRVRFCLLQLGFEVLQLLLALVQLLLALFERFLERVQVRVDALQLSLRVLKLGARCVRLRLELRLQFADLLSRVLARLGELLLRGLQLLLQLLVICMRTVKLRLQLRHALRCKQESREV